MAKWNAISEEKLEEIRVLLADTMHTYSKIAEMTHTNYGAVCRVAKGASTFICIMWWCACTSASPVSQRDTVSIIAMAGKPIMISLIWFFSLCLCTANCMPILALLKV